MTRQRNDSHSTEFGLWLREQPELASSLGYAGTNVDFLWCDYKRDKWMLIEEKRYMASITYSQEQLVNRLIAGCRNDPTFYGFHLLQFEKTSPLDGAMYWDGKRITIEELIKILKFGDE